MENTRILCHFIFFDPSRILGDICPHRLVVVVIILSQVEWVAWSSSTWELRMINWGDWCWNLLGWLCRHNWVRGIFDGLSLWGQKLAKIVGSVTRLRNLVTLAWAFSLWRITLSETHVFILRGLTILSEADGRCFIGVLEIMMIVLGTVLWVALCPLLKMGGHCRYTWHATTCLLEAVTLEIYDVLLITIFE
jgi:hypothetical protein